jgi:hypothetical protein
MKPFANLGMKRGWVLLAAVAILTLTVRLGAQDSPQGLVPAPATLNKHFIIKKYALDFDGDHSLDMATVIERVSSGYETYTVQLHLASGADQSFILAAPPGGLQIEMQDMTGDDVPNDLILRPALLRWLPTVLVNDGHDHFTVAVSTHDPGSITSGQLMDSGGSEGRGTIGLMSSGFRAGGLRHDDELFPQLREISFASVSQFFARESEQSSSSGRAPPLREI